MPPLTALQQTQARQNSYHLFGRLLLSPITADLLPYLESIPELASTIPYPFEPDEAAASHHQLFTFNLYPYASIFLTSNRLLGGEITNEIEAIYWQAGFTADPNIEPDHLGQTFMFLAHLSQKETAAHSLGQPRKGIKLQQLQFLETHLLPWIIPCIIAIKQQDNRLYNELAQLVLPLVANHYDSLQMSGIVPNSIPLTTLTPNPDNEVALKDGRTGLRDIARYLITPNQSGLYLGRSDINQLARSVSLPHGFGSREQQLQTLLESAGQYDTTTSLLKALQSLVARWAKGYEEVVQTYPRMNKYTTIWQNRLQRTQRLLIEMARQVAHEG